MQRRNLLKSLALLAMTERLGGLQSAWAAGAKLAPPGFYQIKGEVKLNGVPAHEGMLVKAGDTVSTGPASQAIYVIGQDAYLQRDNSVVAVAGDILKNGLRILSGKLLAVFGKGNKRIETSTATIGIRGTGCYIESSSAKIYFCLCYGTADITSVTDENHKKTVETRHHDMPLYLMANSKQLTQPAPMLNHTDQELIMLENLVGRLPPFVSMPGYNGSY